MKCHHGALLMLLVFINGLACGGREAEYQRLAAEQVARAKEDAQFAIARAAAAERELKSREQAEQPSAEVKVDDTIEAELPNATPVECRWAKSPIEIDGSGDDEAWQAAVEIGDFAMPWARSGDRQPPTATKARLLWDREYLYFLADMEDSDLYADVKEHDGHTWNNDVFELFFKPAADQPGYYEFQVNAANTQLDAFFPRRNAGGFERFKGDADFEMESQVKLRGSLNRWSDTDEGWTVEGRIPWHDFLHTGGRPEPGDRWTFALCRYDYSVAFEGPALSTSAPLTKRNFHWHEDFRVLRFVPEPAAESDAKAAGITRRIPWTTSRVEGSPEPPHPYRVREVYTNLDVACPMNIVHEPGSKRLWIIHQLSAWGGQGRILRIQDRPDVSDYEMLLEVDGIAYGLAFHPNFAENGYVYIGSNGPFRGAEKTTRVIRYTVDRAEPHRILPDSEKLIIEWASDGHNGGDLAFGPDGYLYVSSGDGTSDSDTNLRGQDLTELTAKVLRIDVDHPADGRAYSVPDDNPFLDIEDARPETWAYGFRNPWRLSIDQESGQLWVGNNGQDLWEQVYLVERGANYGWSVMEGGHPFYLERERGPTPISKPAADHPHSEARSLTGGLVYRGQKLPGLVGAYIYGDWSTGKIWGLKHDGQQATWHQEIADTPLAIAGFGTDAAGELIVCDHGGGFYQLEPYEVDVTQPDFPRLLSETGVFASVPDHQIAPGLVPYSVNAPLWSDGAIKERYFGLPEGDEPPKIEVTHRNGWNFPEKTVLVKSFALEMREGDPASRRWIETRLMTKQQGEWVGYSYRWNDKGTDAELVDKAGADVEFTIHTGDGDEMRTQIWHYPSRSECMVCHSRAANFVLGLSTRQLNKLHDYGGVTENQLVVLERLGVLDVDWTGDLRRLTKEKLEAAGFDAKDVTRRLSKQNAGQQQTKAKRSTLLAMSPEHYPRLADPYNEQADLHERATAYLHANCAICHVKAGGGNAQIDLAITTSLQDRNWFDTPLHDTFGIQDARILAPGSPERSVLLERVTRRGRGQMPPLATRHVDHAAAKLLEAWIRDLDDLPE